MAQSTYIYKDKADKNIRRFLVSVFFFFFFSVFSVPSLVLYYYFAKNNFHEIIFIFMNHVGYICIVTYTITKFILFDRVASSIY